jgi:hypothetical protein
VLSQAARGFVLESKSNGEQHDCPMGIDAAQQLGRRAPGAAHRSDYHIRIEH